MTPRFEDRAETARGEATKARWEARLIPVPDRSDYPSPEAQDAIARAIEEHQFTWGLGKCSCGVRLNRADHPLHVAGWVLATRVTAPAAPAWKCWRSECRNGCHYPDVCNEPTRPTPPVRGRSS